MIIREIIYNLSVLVTLTVISKTLERYFESETVKGKILQGILFGFTIIIGMMYPFTLSEGIFFDGRSVLLSLCALFYGPVAVVVAGIIAVIYRLALGGIGTFMGILIICSSSATGLVFNYYIKKNKKKISLFAITNLGITTHLIMILIMLSFSINFSLTDVSSLFLTVILLYPIATVVIGMIIINYNSNRALVENLKFNEKKLETYFDAAPDAVLVANSEGKFIEANAAAERITGYTKKEICQKSILDLAMPEDTEWALNHFNTVVETGKSYGESKFIRKDGSIGWWSIDAVKIDENNILGFLKDITDKKKSEIKVEEALMKFQTIFDLSPTAKFVLKFDSNILIDVNSKFEEISGYSRNEMIGKNFNDFKFWLSQEKRTEYLNLLKKQNQVTNFTADFVNRYGKIINGLVSASVITLDSELYVIAIVSDVTYFKKSEDELKKSESKFRDLIEELPDGFYQSSPEGKFIYINPAFVKMFGYASRDELMQVDIPNVLYFKPEDRKKDKMKAADYSGEYNIYCMKRKNGQPIWLEDHSRNKYDSTGKIIQHEGICRDITDRILTQQTNLELIGKITKTSKHLPGFIYQFCKMTDGTFSLPFLSDGIEEVFGYSKEHFYKDINVFFNAIYPDDYESIIKSIIHSAENLSIWHEEFRIIHIDGRIKWFEGHSTPERLEDGSIIWYGFANDITKRKYNDTILQKSELSLRYSQKIAKMGSWELDFLTNKITWSENLYIIYGYEPFSFEPDFKSFLKIIHPKDYEFVKKINDEFYKTRAETSFEFRILLTDGSSKWLLNNIVPNFENGQLVSLNGINIDITERKKTERDLKKLSRAIEQSPLAIVITNTESKIEYVNPKFTQITGYTFNEVSGRNPNILKSGKMTSDFYAGMWETLTQGNEWQGEILNKRKNGELYWESMIIAPVKDENGLNSHYIAIKEDITDKIQIQNDLIFAKEKAEESDRLKSAFLANMSHEIRTPMNGIIGFSKMLGYPDLTKEEREEFAKILNTSCNRLLNTVNDILEISKIESKQIEIRTNLIIPYQLIEELYDFHVDNFTDKEIIFSKNLKGITSGFIFYSDEQKIYRILDNFLNNALKFTDTGEVELGCQLNADKIEFYVKDTGIGISENALELIFGRFNQENNSLSRGFEGSGLGLAICKGLAEVLEGRIYVESKRGKGSKFSLELPLKMK